MTVEVTAEEFKGKVRAPSSKSALQRLIAGALLANGKSIIDAASSCDDSDAAFAIASVLGAGTGRSGNMFEIEGGFKPSGKEIFCGESGLSARMFTPIAALHDSELVLTGRGSLLSRPFDMATATLESLGVRVVSNNGFLPLKITGPIRPGRIVTDGSVSSQFVTGLLMALPVAANDSELVVENLVSRPYVDLTIEILAGFGVFIDNRNYKSFFIKGGQKYLPGKFTAEGDWSGAAFLAVMGAIGGEVEITGLNRSSFQADRAILDALRLAGASVVEGESHVTVGRKELKPFEFDISNCPDLAPPLAILALACNGESVMHGAGRLVAKESNRAASICRIIEDIGGNALHSGDTIVISGGKKLRGGASDSFNDHRIAMALSVASVLCESPVTVGRMESINKSYPGFTDHFMQLGGSVKTR